MVGGSRPRRQGRTMMQTFEVAAFDLQRQSIARGFDSRLDDLDIALCENGRSVDPGLPIAR